jgi:hypothetical protein
VRRDHHDHERRDALTRGRATQRTVKDSRHRAEELAGLRTSDQGVGAANRSTPPSGVTGWGRGPVFDRVRDCALGSRK